MAQLPTDLLLDLAQLPRAAAAKAEENRAFQMFVNLEVPLSDRQLNAVVQDTTTQVWQHIDCQSCAQCCRTRYPTFSRAEVQRIAAHLGTTLDILRASHLSADAETGKYTLKSLPCPFLEGNQCSIYPVRPAVCADYPHLHKNFRARLWQNLDNTETCPIVYNVVERLKDTFHFRRETS
ncbi:MAG: YkgJ family cysteine cluster protein [Candidatus Tectimicrobiota bacterium]